MTTLVRPLDRATLLTGVKWWALGMAVAFSAYVAIVVHEYRSTDRASQMSGDLLQVSLQLVGTPPVTEAVIAGDRINPVGKLEGEVSACPMKRRPVG